MTEIILWPWEPWDGAAAPTDLSPNREATDSEADRDGSAANTLRSRATPRHESRGQEARLQDLGLGQPGRVD
jgi:hypothetical protein